MKKTTLILALVVCGFFVYAQKPISLNFETHALKNGTNNDMILCEYVQPGNGGSNIVWDFSGLVSRNDFTGTIGSAYKSSNSLLFSSANTELIEFNNSFFFKISDNKMEQWGYASKNNSVIINYEKPFVKMKFPFNYGDNINGDFFGTYTSRSFNGTINGNYKVTADGYGRLLLPGDYVAENTLRVKTVKSYTRTLNGKSQLIDITTYRWYNEYRYPLLVLTEIKTTTNNSPSFAYQAAYNNAPPIITANNEFIATNKFNTFPNPVRGKLNINYTMGSKGNAYIALYDISGRLVKTFIDSEIAAGDYSISIEQHDLDVRKGMYLLKAELNSELFTREIVFSE